MHCGDSLMRHHLPLFSYGPSHRLAPMFSMTIYEKLCSGLAGLRETPTGKCYQRLPGTGCRIERYLFNPAVKFVIKVTG